MTNAEINGLDDSTMISETEERIHERVLSIGDDMKLPVSVRFISFILGAAVLLPWNALIIAIDYLTSRVKGSPFHSAFASYLSLSFLVANFFFLAHATFAPNRMASARVIRLTLCAIAVLNLLLALTTFITLPPTLFFLFAILNGIAQAAAGSYNQCSLIAVISLLGPTAIQPLFSGQAAVGVLFSLVQILTSTAGVTTNESGDTNSKAAARSAFLFFGISTLFILFSIFMHARLVDTTEYRTIVVPFEKKPAIVSLEEERQALVGSNGYSDSPNSKPRMLHVIKKNARYNFAVAYVFVATLAVFPAITSFIRSVQYPPTTLFTHPLLFTALHFLMFNLGDLIGRYLPLIPLFQVWDSYTLLSLSLSRTIFIPLFLACNFQAPSSPPGPPEANVIIGSDFIFFLIMLLFGASNGYLSTLVMMAVPSPQRNPWLRHNPKDIEISATIAQFCLIGGLAFGSFLSFGVTAFVCSCNPFTT
ncbi:hypothetical protein Clacol_001959 [Clathrus columnatus]|uniref:Nucleoside transporter-domain-containing protein n=1 Tax=Clathrus columnatus TaxID=1419009 RepID=A0AAV4ZZH2_9AGAM|nr:hypothetical protein Clacol_001959 [Clathrus columnatus]